jgi:hypothetical protein
MTVSPPPAIAKKRRPSLADIVQKNSPENPLIFPIAYRLNRQHGVDERISLRMKLFGLWHPSQSRYLRQQAVNIATHKPGT